MTRTWFITGASRGFGRDSAIKATLIEPGGFSTDWGGSSAKHAAELSDYDEVRTEVMAARAKRLGTPGDPESSAAAVLKIVDADVPPLRVFFGDGPLSIAEADYASRLETWRAWQDVSIQAGGH